MHCPGSRRATWAQGDLHLQRSQQPSCSVWHFWALQLHIPALPVKETKSSLALYALCLLLAQHNKLQLLDKLPSLFLEV